RGHRGPRPRGLAPGPGLAPAGCAAADPVCPAAHGGSDRPGGPAQGGGAALAATDRGARRAGQGPGRPRDRARRTLAAQRRLVARAVRARLLRGPHRKRSHLPGLSQPGAMAGGGDVRLTYAELHCQSAFSFRDGASLPEDLVGRAAELGLSALALTDRDGIYGAPRFWKAARAVGLRPLVGADVAVPGGGRLLLLCESQRGYKNLCRLLSRAHLENPRERPCASWDALEENAAGLVALCRHPALVD